MNDLQREREDLITADRHLAAGEQRITEQLALIGRLSEQATTQLRPKTCYGCWKRS